MNWRKLFVPVAFMWLTLVSISAQTQTQKPFDDWNQPFKPFRIIGNIYYVGTNNLACFLITSPAGYVLIDTAMQESAPIIRANIESLGYKLKYVRLILSSHAHFDHVAGHADMKAATGAQVVASAADALALESGGAKGFHPIGSYKPVKVDRIIKDGEIVRLGSIALKAHLTPGHTEGNTAWSMTVEENGKKYEVLFAPSMSINPGVKMVNNPTWPTIADAYARSFQKLKSLPCDVFLGPHAPFFDMEAKVARMKADPKANPFIDPEGFRNYIAGFEKGYNDQLQKERSGK